MKLGVPIAAAAIVALIFFGGWLALNLHSQSRSLLAFHNAGETPVRIAIKSDVSGAALWTDDIAPGATVRRSIRSRREAALSVECRDATITQTQLGYVTAGFDMVASVEISGCGGVTAVVDYR